LHSVEAGPVNLEIIFEHRMYLPMTMLSLVASAVVVDANPRIRIRMLAGALIFLVVLAGWTHERNQVWADPLEFRRDIAAKSPEKARAQSNFALALHEAGRNEEALVVSRRAVELDKANPKPLKVLGDVLVDLGRPREAADVFRTAIGMDSTNVKYLLGLGEALVASGDEEAAFQHYLGSGVELGRNGRPWEAITILKEAVRLHSEDGLAYNALGSAYATAGLREQAVEQFGLAIRLDPDKIEAWFNLGLIADAIGDRDEALRGYKGFVERAPSELQQPIARARSRIVALSQEPISP
jgi:tetratricopeptide (TPR) repeat protein